MIERNAFVFVRIVITANIPMLSSAVPANSTEMTLIRDEKSIDSNESPLTRNAFLTIKRDVIIIYFFQQHIMDPTYVNVNAFASKFKSKREVYTFLTVDARAFLPPFLNVTIYFLKAIIMGQKKCK